MFRLCCPHTSRERTQAAARLASLEPGNHGVMALKSALFVIVIVIAVLGSSCASEMSLPEYAEEVEALVTTMNARLDELDVEFVDTANLSGIKEYARERVKARTDFLSGMNELDAPEVVVELHTEAISIMDRVVETEGTLSEMVQNLDSVSDVDSIWETPEGVAARTADERAVALCEAAQDTLDSTASGSDLEGVPWIPPEMKQIVRVAFGCHAELRQP